MKKTKMIIIAVLISIFSSYILVIMVSKKINNKILKYSRVEAKRFASTIINSSTSKIINNKNLSKNLLKVEKNSDNEIEEVSFNTINVNNLLKKVTENIQDELISIEEGKTSSLNVSSSIKGNHFKNIRKGVVCEIPSGSVFGNVLMANTGPILPVKLSFIGKVYTKVSTNIKTYGINSAYIELNIEITITERISIPNLTEDIKVKKKIPLVMQIIQGKIPDYYDSSKYQNNKDYALPLDD